MFNFLRRLFGLNKSVPVQIPEPVKPDRVIVTPVEPGEPIKLRVKILDTSGFSKSDLEKIKKAEDIIEVVVNSAAYAFDFLDAKFTETNGDSNKKILDTLLSGDCQFTDADGTMDLKLIMYYKRYSGVVGYFDGTPFSIFINRKFFSTPLSIASNLLHEYFHMIGYSHYGVFDTSVPYLGGNTIFERVAIKLGMDKL